MNSAQWNDRLKFISTVVLTLFFNIFIQITLKQILFPDFDPLTATISQLVLETGLRFLSIFISINLGVLIYNKMIKGQDFTEKNGQINETKKENQLSLTPSQKNTTVDLKEDYEKLYEGFTLKNFGSQILHGLFLFAVIYIPLDYLSYLIPRLMDFQILAIEQTTTGFLLNNYSFITIISVALVIQFFIGLREELFFRVFLSGFAGENTIKKNSAFVFSSVLFGLAHFSYIFSPTITSASTGYVIWWGLTSFFIGCISAYYYLEHKKIIPIVLAHWLNNVVSIMVISQYMEGHTMNYSLLHIYLPIFILGIILLFAYRKTLKDHLFKVKNSFAEYYKELNGMKEIIIDIGIILFLWMVLLLFLG